VIGGNELLDAVVDLLEAATHSILYHRHVYARQHFRFVNKYNVPCPMSRSPLLCDYVAAALGHLRSALARGIVDEFAVDVLHRESALLVERFVFELSPLREPYAVAVALPALESELRGFLNVLGLVGGRLVPLAVSAAGSSGVPEADEESNYVFNLQIVCNDGASANDDEAIAQHWVPVTCGAPDDDDNVPILVPFKSANLGSLRLQLFCLENREAKQQR